MRFEDRVVGSFKGLATGDAIGKQTETLTRAGVGKWYPGGITGFHGRPGAIIARSAGKRYEWRTGETTDDTEQTLAVARALLAEGRASHVAIGRELLQCRKSAHPGVSLWSFLQSGNPARLAPDGDGCGAAMRAAPIGVICPSGELDELVRGAYDCAIPTHGGQLAICAAAAVAAAVSAALEALPAPHVLAISIEAAKAAERFRPSAETSTIAHAIRQTYSDLASRKHLEIDDVARQSFPNRPQTIVPLAISLALIIGSVEQAVLFAANLGGDADSVASISGAIGGALNPATVNESWFEVVSTINSDSLVDTAISLSAMRRRGGEAGG
jgi:ADP-ribosylglycohydrolase